MRPDVNFKGDFGTVRFALELAPKDVGLATARACEYNVPMPLATGGEHILSVAFARGSCDGAPSRPISISARPLRGHTAWHCLIERVQLQPGKTS
jgi:hypothetical protein